MKAKKVKVIPGAEGDTKLTDQEAIQQALKEVEHAKTYLIQEVKYISADAKWHIQLQEWQSREFSNEKPISKIISVEDK